MSRKLQRATRDLDKQPGATTRARMSTRLRRAKRMADRENHRCYAKNRPICRASPRPSLSALSSSPACRHLQVCGFHSTLRPEPATLIKPRIRPDAAGSCAEADLRRFLLNEMTAGLLWRKRSRLRLDVRIAAQIAS
jgi:hypothetical protein